MTDQNAQRDFALVVVLIGFGAIFAILITLAAFQPQIGAWISAAAETEMAHHSPDQQTMTVTELKRRPIEPGSWAEVVPPKMADAQSR
jgi:Na+-transporting methylmalonyl-CoA/oxaloacetate decarboxylase gamma subunit